VTLTSARAMHLRGLMSNPIRAAFELGQSIWYDDLSRALLKSGQLAHMVGEGLAGVTSNPTTFEKAIDESRDYDDDLVALVARGVRDPKEIFESLAVADIQRAADTLRPVYDGTGGRDGFVSFEVSPHLARDTERTIAEARRLFAAVGRDNVMIKVPGTPEGIPAVERLTALGVNVNITLLFAIDAYRAVAEAYMAGLEQRATSGGAMAKTASVASFFLSRIDVLVDERIAAVVDRDPGRRARLDTLWGKIAVASAKLAYREYEWMTASPRWQAIARRGARTQRLLWASTTPKNPSYPKTLYVDGLVGRDTINTMTAETYREFRAQGAPRLTITDGVAEAERTLASLGELGISLADATAALTEQGIVKFAASFDKLLTAIGRRATSAA
jgi:transaldolase / glucose-6-phosphate isomerase